MAHTHSGLNGILTQTQGDSAGTDAAGTLLNSIVGKSAHFMLNKLAINIVDTGVM